MGASISKDYVHFLRGFFFFETGSHVALGSLKFYVVKDESELLIFLPPPFEYWDYRFMAPCPVYAVLGIGSELGAHKASTLPF